MQIGTHYQHHKFIIDRINLLAAKYPAQLESLASSTTSLKQESKKSGAEKEVLKSKEEVIGIKAECVPAIELIHLLTSYKRIKKSIEMNALKKRKINNQNK